MDSWFYVGIIPHPSREDNTSVFPASLRELFKIKKNLEGVSQSDIYIEERLGDRYRYKPIELIGKKNKKTERKDSGPYAPACPADPGWVELLVGLASPALATAFYKILKAWIEAKAGREIKLKFGSWNAEFKGLNERQVIKLFRALQDISKDAAETKSSGLSRRAGSKRIAALLKELHIPAVAIEKAPQKASVPRQKEKKGNINNIENNSIKEGRQKGRKKSAKRVKE